MAFHGPDLLIIHIGFCGFISNQGVYGLVCLVATRGTVETSVKTVRTVDGGCHKTTSWMHNSVFNSFHHVDQIRQCLIGSNPQASDYMFEGAIYV